MSVSVKNVTQTNTSDVPLMYHCLDQKNALLVSVGLIVSKVLIYIPVIILVVHLGVKRWRRDRSTAAVNHSDVFTYHVVAMQMIFVLGVFVHVCGLITQDLNAIETGIYLTAFIFPAETVFHILTCAERYLAVVHPVTYLKLRQSGGVRIRNMSIGCGWLQSFGWIGVTHVYSPNIPYVPTLCYLVASLVLISFCNVSVLVALIRPGPGDLGGDRVRVAQTKQRAFYTISAILGVLLVFFIWVIFALSLEFSQLLSPETGCLLLVFGNLWTLPSDLVLPLLYLHRAGKLTCCCGNKK